MRFSVVLQVLSKASTIHVSARYSRLVVCKLTKLMYVLTTSVVCVHVYVTMHSRLGAGGISVGSGRGSICYIAS